MTSSDDFVWKLVKNLAHKKLSSLKTSTTTRCLYRLLNLARTSVMGLSSKIKVSLPFTYFPLYIVDVLFKCIVPSVGKHKKLDSICDSGFKHYINIYCVLE